MDLLTLTDLQMEAQSLNTTDGAYTGARLQAKHPRLYQSIIRMLGDKMGVRQIARLLGVHTKTVAAVRDHSAHPIATVKKHLSAQLFGVAGMALEMAQERLENLDGKENLRDLMVGAGIAVDKALLLAGEATMRVEFTQAAPGHEDYLATLQTIEAEATETDLEGETGGQKGAPTTRLALPAAPDRVTIEMPTPAERMPARPAADDLDDPEYQGDADV
jgi:hypothetical protein